jgi:hypothetical protein
VGVWLPDGFWFSTGFLARHVQPRCQRLPPSRRCERLAPVVGHADGLSVAELGDRDVPVHPAVAIVGAPFDDEGVANRVPPAHPEPQTHEVGFDLADSRPPLDPLATLGPLAHGVLGQPNAEDALQAGLVESARTTPSSSARTRREVARMSTRVYGSRGWV